MPYSFFEIERQKNWVIWFLFAFLVCLYFLVFFLSWLVVKNVSISIYEIVRSNEKITKFYFHFLTFKESSFIFIIAFIVGIIHWSISQFQIVEKILALLRAELLNPEDKYHQILKNTIEEASIACGGAKFESYVIPTSVLNAFSIADFSGRQVIGVTEGLLAKLNRRQVQAVVGHEIAHILSGDCLSSTVVCSLFEFYCAILSKLRKCMSESDPTVIDEQKRLWILLVPIYIIVSILNYLSYFINIFISRQREYRADAISVRLTRDPLGLSEALYIISRGWNGEGLQGDRLSSIFIVNPRSSLWDEREDFLSDMISTHPPIKKRIDVLLAMAGLDMKTLVEMCTARKKFVVQKIPSPVFIENKWLIANSDNQWLGPFDFTEIIQLDWLKPYSWVRKIAEDKAKLAYEDTDLKRVFQATDSINFAKFSCPNCYQAMEELDYEGRLVWHCAFCRGFLIKRSDFKRILIREETSFSEEVVKMAELMIHDINKVKLNKNIINTQNLICCPGCNRKMQRIFFNWGEVVDIYDLGPQDKTIHRLASKALIPFVIDKCGWCDTYWFDQNKLEILQYIYEKH